MEGATLLPWPGWDPKFPTLFPAQFWMSGAGADKQTALSVALYGARSDSYQGGSILMVATIPGLPLWRIPVVTDDPGQIP